MTAYNDQTLELSGDEAGLVASALRMLATKKRKNARSASRTFGDNMRPGMYEALMEAANMCDEIVDRLKTSGK